MSAGHLKNHKEIHQQDRKYRCHYEGCNESYARQQRLQVHLNKHKGKRDFVCPI